MDWKELRQKDKNMALTKQGCVYIYGLMIIGFLIALIGIFSHHRTLIIGGLSIIPITIIYNVYLVSKPIGYKGLTKRKD